MELRLDGGRIVPIAQMGLDFVIVKQPFEYPPTNAEIYMRIDDSESTWRVHLVEGISKQRRKTMIGAVPPK
jgi:hypothetical protein